jgi:phosphatidylinositol dimannoside acyltransferase
MSSETREHALPPHAPELGWTRRLLGRFHVTGVFWFWFHAWGVCFLPTWGVIVFVSIFTTFFWVALRKIRAALAANLVPVLGPCGFFTRQVRIYRTMWNFAWCLSERYERLGTERTFSVEVDTMERWKALGGSERGFVMATAHLGNFEVGSMLPASEEKRPVHLVREAEVDPRAQVFIRDLISRSSAANHTTHFQTDDPLQGMVLLEALREGGIVAVQSDRPRTGGRNLTATLFGRPFPLPEGPIALARSAGVPIVPIFVFREGRRRYRVAIREPIDVARTRDRNTDVATAVRRIAAEIERAIRERPYQWFCFRRVF